MDDVSGDWELVCDYNPHTRNVVYCYLNNQTEQQVEELPAELAEFCDQTTPTDWIGHLSTSYLPFRQFYTHKGSNISVWHEPKCIETLRQDYVPAEGDWAIRSKPLEMQPDISESSFDFKGTTVVPENATAMEKFQYDLLQNNKEKYVNSNGKVSPDFVCFYRNNVTQQCIFEIPPILDQFQLSSESHRDWIQQLSTNINKFFFIHDATNLCLWDMPLVCRLNRDKNIQNSTEKDWRMFISSEHKKPLYIHSKTKTTQFELPGPLAAIEATITNPADWDSGINPLTLLPYYHSNKHAGLNIWHVPSALVKVNRDFHNKMADFNDAKKKEKNSTPVVDLNYSYWEIQYISYKPPNSLTEEPEKVLKYYKHRITKECTTTLPPSIVAYIKTTKPSDWSQSSIKDTKLNFFVCSHKVPNDPYSSHSKTDTDTASEPEDNFTNVAIWIDPLSILEGYSKAIQQTNAQLLVPVNQAEETLDPEDDIDNWLIYYDPNATNTSTADTLKDIVKAKTRKQSTASTASTASKSTPQNNDSNNDEDTYGNLQSGPLDDDDDDEGLGGGLVSSHGGSGLGDLISSTTFQFQGLKLGDLSKISPRTTTTTLQNSALPRTELEEGYEVGIDQVAKRPSFSTFSFSTTQRHLTTTTRGQQYYFNTVTKRIQSELPTCFEIFQASLDASVNTPDDWESAVGKISPFPFYRYKHKSSIVMWHEPVCVRDFRCNVYEITEAENLMGTVKDWVIRFVREANSAYYKNVKTHWYQTTIPFALEEYQRAQKDIQQWESIMSHVCVGVVVYCHINARGDVGCNLLHMPDVMKEKMAQIQDCKIDISPIDCRFNINPTFQENVLNWILQYDSTSNTIYYRNTKTHYLSTNIPKPLYLIGTSRYSTHNLWQQTRVYFDADGDVLTQTAKDELDAQIAANPSLGKSKNKLYVEKICYEYHPPTPLNKTRILVFHRPHVLRDHARQSEKFLDWALIRSSDNTQLLYKNKHTNELQSELPLTIRNWLDTDAEAGKAELWVGCVDSTLKQSYYKHKQTNIMIAARDEPPVLEEIRKRTYTQEQELLQWTIFANKVDNKVYYKNKITQQIAIDQVPTVLFQWSCTTKKDEWNFVPSTGAINKGYWYHIPTANRLWDQPNWME
jgi:hypothetical protein